LGELGRERKMEKKTGKKERDDDKVPSFASLE
jgi:hypothetical protein